MRISKTFKQNRTVTGIEYQAQLTGEITCTLNNQYGIDTVYKYGNSNSISFTANLFLTQNDVYLIKKHTGKQLPEGKFATVRVCMFGKDGDHLARQPLCKHGQKVAFYADDWQISSYYTSKGELRYRFDAIISYYRFIDSTEEATFNGYTSDKIDYAITKGNTSDKIVDAWIVREEGKADKPKTKQKRSKNEVTDAEIEEVLRKAEEAMKDDPFEDFDQISFDETGLPW